MSFLLVRVPMAFTLLSVVACTIEPPTPPPESRASALRTAVTTLPSYAVPDCAAADHCPDIQQDAAWCSDQANLFEVTMLGELVADIEVVDADLASSGLAPGAWHTIFPDPTGGCEPVIVNFQVSAEGV